MNRIPSSSLFLGNFTDGGGGDGYQCSHLLRLRMKYDMMSIIISVFGSQLSNKCNHRTSLIFYMLLA